MAWLLALTREVNGADPNAHNSFEKPEAVKIERLSFDLSGQSFDYTVPAQSVTLLRFRIDQRWS
jgi:alpha-L-arabinofuranosidase